MKLRYLGPVGLSVLVLLAMAPAAQALDAADFAGKVVSVYSSSLSPGDKLTFGAGTVTGTDITYDGVTLTTSGSTEPMTMNTKLQFHGVTEQPDGSYTADLLTFPDVDSKFDTTEVTVKNIALKHIFVPNGKSPNILDSSRLFQDASAGPLVVSVDGKQVLSIDSTSVSNALKPSQQDPALAEIDSNGVTSGLKFDMTGAKDADAAAQAKALGLEKVTGKALEAMTWTLKDGHLNLSEVSVDFDQIGKLKFGLDITGYTPEFLKSLSAATQSLVADQGSGNSADQSKQAAALLGAAQTLFLNSTSLRYDDASITARVLDFLAKQQGVTKQALIDQVVAGIPGEMNDGTTESVPPDMVQTVQAAVQIFLANPHSIEIKLAPKAPLGVLGIVAAAMAPTNLAEQIGLQLLVNDKPITAKDYVAPPADTSTTPPADDSSSAPADNLSSAPAGNDKLSSKHLH